MTSGYWEWPSVADALENAGLWPINKYIQRRKNTVAVQLAYMPIYELCKGA